MKLSKAKCSISNEFFSEWTDCFTYQIFFYWHLKVWYCFVLQAPEKLTRWAERCKSHKHLVCISISMLTFTGYISFFKKPITLVKFNPVPSSINLCFKSLLGNSGQIYTTFKVSFKSAHQTVGDAEWCMENDDTQCISHSNLLLLLCFLHKQNLERSLNSSSMPLQQPWWQVAAIGLKERSASYSKGFATAVLTIERV